MHELDLGKNMKKLDNWLKKILHVILGDLEVSSSSYGPPKSTYRNCPCGQFWTDLGSFGQKCSKCRNVVVMPW